MPPLEAVYTSILLPANKRGRLPCKIIPYNRVTIAPKMAADGHNFHMESQNGEADLRSSEWL